MVRWLAKATDVWRRRESPQPQPFDLACICGHRISGVRQSNFLVMRCNRCGEPLFVLPSDVYPRPKPKKTTKKRVAANAPASTAAERQTTKSVQSALAGKMPARAREAGELSDRAAPVAPPRPSLGRDLSDTTRVIESWMHSIFTPFRLIVLAIVGVVAGTGYFAWHSHMKETAALTLRQHLETGEDALRHGQLHDAADEFRQAALAVDRLGREDQESLIIRQKAKELHAMVNLAPASLYEICDQARELAPQGNGKWAEKFRQLYHNSWIIVEGDIAKEAGPNGRSQPVIRFPFPIDEAPVILNARLKALEPLTATGHPTKVIFAGQLASIEKEGRKDPVWVIRLNDETVFLWTDAETYQALGMGEDDPQAREETSRILDQQAAAVGIKP